MKPVAEMAMRAVSVTTKILVLVIPALCLACATLPKLDVTYKTLPEPRAFPVPEIYFKVTDKRPIQDFIGPGAKKVYRNFAGNITLIVETGRGKQSIVGVYNVKEIFEHTFTRYLENKGLTLLPNPKDVCPRLEVAIHDFTLDLAGPKWISRIAYKAEFSYLGRNLIRNYQGEGEKFRISGLRQAHEVMSETFSEIVHRLDLREMLSALRER